MDALNLACLLSPTLTCSHSPNLKKAQTFSSPPCPLLGSSVSTRIPAGRKEDQSRSSPHPFPFWTSGCLLLLGTLTPSLTPAASPATVSAQTRTLPPARCSPARKRGHSVPERHSEDTEVTHRPLRLCSLTPHPHGTDNPPRPGHWRSYPQGPGGGGGGNPRKAALPLLSPG